MLKLANKLTTTEKMVYIVQPSEDQPYIHHLKNASQLVSNMEVGAAVWTAYPGSWAPAEFLGKVKAKHLRLWVLECACGIQKPGFHGASLVKLARKAITDPSIPKKHIERLKRIVDKWSRRPTKRGTRTAPTDGRENLKITYLAEDVLKDALKAAILTSEDRALSRLVMIALGAATRVVSANSGREICDAECERQEEEIIKIMRTYRE